MEIISFCTICVHVSYSKFVVNNHHIFLTFFLTKFSFLVLPCLSLTFESEVPVIDLNNQFQKDIDDAKKCAMLSDLAEKKNTSTMQSTKLSTTQAENTSSNASGDRKDSVSSESVMSHVQSFEKKISELHQPFVPDVVQQNAANRGQGGRGPNAHMCVVGPLEHSAQTVVAGGHHLAFLNFVYVHSIPDELTLGDESDGLRIRLWLELISLSLRAGMDSFHVHVQDELVGMMHQSNWVDIFF